MIFIAFGFFLALAVLVVLARERHFRSSAKLFVRVGRENVALDPTVTIGQTISMRTSRETEINSVVEMLRGRPVIERVVDVLGAEHILGAPENASWLQQAKQIVPRLKRLLRSLVNADSGKGSSSIRDKAIAEVLRRLSVTAPEMSAVITVSYEAASAELAQQVVAAITDAYLEEHVRLNRTAGSEDFFNQQATKSGQELAAAKRRLKELKNEHGVGSIDARIELLEQQTSHVQTLIQANEAAISAARAKADALRERMEPLEETVLVQRTDGIGDRGVEGMRQQLYDLELREQQLLSTYHEAHPAVQAIRQQVAEARRIQGARPESRSQATYASNPARQELHLELLRVEAELAALEATRQALAQQRESALEEVRKLNQQQLLHDELEQDVAMMTINFRAHRASLEQARVDRALQEKRITNVNVAQPATWDPEPIGPGRAALGLVGFVLSAVGAFGVGCLVDFMDPHFRSRDELERMLNTSVLLSVPCRRDLESIA